MSGFLPLQIHPGGSICDVRMFKTSRPQPKPFHTHHCGVSLTDRDKVLPPHGPYHRYHSLPPPLSLSRHRAHLTLSIFSLSLFLSASLCLISFSLPLSLSISLSLSLSQSLFLSPSLSLSQIHVFIHHPFPLFGLPHSLFFFPSLQPSLCLLLSLPCRCREMVHCEKQTVYV